jgi:hypothetical protein
MAKAKKKPVFKKDHLVGDSIIPKTVELPKSMQDNLKEGVKIKKPKAK